MSTKVDYHSQIINTLVIKFVQGKRFKLLKSITAHNFYDIENLLLAPKHTALHYRYNGQSYQVQPGHMLFLPSGQVIDIAYGECDPINLNKLYLFENAGKYFQVVPKSTQDETATDIDFISFDARLLGHTNFFAVLNPAPFVMPMDADTKQLFEQILLEHTHKEMGNEKIVQYSTSCLVIKLVRNLLRHVPFVKSLQLGRIYFEDERILPIVKYVHHHLAGHLSNKELAKLINVSEDYLSQLFKSLTGIRLQEYIECQRMEKSIKLLRGNHDQHIQDISKAVGFSAIGYFCRRFKLRFGIPASKVREQGFLLQV